MHKVLIVDDDPVQLRLTAEVARKAGYDVLTATGGSEALAVLHSDNVIGAMVLDLVMPDLDGMSVLGAMKRASINVPVIVQTASSSLETIVSAMRLGASDYFVKPVAPERLTTSLRNILKIEELESCLRTERARKSGTLGFNAIIGTSPALERSIKLAAKAAKSAIPVLIEGESGVGKELFARAIQGSGDRAGKPFIAVNCGAIPANLVESTLFGHVKGAFTGASTNHAGKFQEANGGTLFLDEVGELPHDAQVKLLRAIQEGEIEPVGADRPVKVNVRLISATNRRLLNMAKAGTFREDLYYRLNVYPFYVPPLRERREDIAALAAHFVSHFSAETSKRVAGISPSAIALLQSYDWPGNIRQLENAIYRAVVLAEQTELQISDFPQITAQVSGADEVRRSTAILPTPTAAIHIDDADPQPRQLTRTSVETTQPSDRFLDTSREVRALTDVERDLIVFAIAHHNGHMSKVARALGIGRSTLYRKLKEYGLEGEISALAA